MKIKLAAQCMAELGHPKRLAIYRLLVKTGHKGLPVGKIGEKLGIPGSTLSHHLKRLSTVGLIKQNPKKQTIHCTALYQQLNDLICFLTDKCCQGNNDGNNKTSNDS